MLWILLPSPYCTFKHTFRSQEACSGLFYTDYTYPCRYLRRQLSTSTVSMEWTTGEPYSSPYVAANRVSISTLTTPITFTPAPNNNNSSSRSSSHNSSSGGGGGGNSSDNDSCNTPSNTRKHSSHIMGTPV